MGRFDRSITLPIEVDQDRVTAECRDGVLAVTLPRAERENPVRSELADQRSESRQRCQVLRSWLSAKNRN